MDPRLRGESTPAMPGTTAKGAAVPLRGRRLTRVQFDDQRFVDVGSDLVTLREGTEGAFHLLGVDRDPARHAALLGQRQGFDDTGLLLGLFADSDDVAGLDLVRSDVHDLA